MLVFSHHRRGPIGACIPLLTVDLTDKYSTDEKWSLDKLISIDTNRDSDIGI